MPLKMSVKNQVTAKLLFSIVAYIENLPIMRCWTSFLVLIFSFVCWKEGRAKCPSLRLRSLTCFQPLFLTLFANAEQISMRKQWETFLPHKNFYTMLCTHFNGKLSFFFFLRRRIFLLRNGANIFGPPPPPLWFFYDWVLCTKYLLNKRVRRKKPSWSQS